MTSGRTPLQLRALVRNGLALAEHYAGIIERGEQPPPNFHAKLRLVTLQLREWTQQLSAAPAHANAHSAPTAGENVARAYSIQGDSAPVPGTFGITGEEAAPAR